MNVEIHLWKTNPLNMAFVQRETWNALSVESKLPVNSAVMLRFLSRYHKAVDQVSDHIKNESVRRITKKVLHKAAPILGLVVTVGFGIVSCSGVMPQGNIDDQASFQQYNHALAYSDFEPIATPYLDAAIPTTGPIQLYTGDPRPNEPVTYPCAADGLSIAEHMLACVGHEPPYSLRETIDTYVPNYGTYKNPDWGLCTPGNLGCIAGGQNIENAHQVGNMFFHDRAGFFFDPPDENCASAIDCEVYRPIQNP